MAERIAALDIGTNTVLMVVGEKCDDGSIEILRDEHSIARLGEKTDYTNLISEEALERTVKILESYRQICSDLKVDRIVTGATSALRDASNSKIASERLQESLGAKINIIAGLEEARLSFLGTVETDDKVIVIDIGGGSTEIISGRNRILSDRTSLQIGAVRLTERCFSNQPPTINEKNIAIAEIENALLNVEWQKHESLYSVAGTPTTIAAVALGLGDFERDKIHGYELTRETLDEILHLFLKSTSYDLIRKYHIHPKRADVITAGALILREAMDHFDFTETTVSAKGLRYGILLDAFQ